MAHYFRRAAGRIGLRVLGAERWNGQTATYRRLALRVKRTHPDVVFLSGLLDDHGGAVLKAVRRRVGREVQIIANDGFLPVSDLFRLAGPAARGVYVSLGGLPPQALSPEGRNFVHDFGAAQPALPIHQHSVYAAAAATTMLDAIAESDGTRASVTDRLLASHPAGGILGAFRFDAHGDVSPAPITIVLAVRGGGDDAVESIDGARIQSVIRPRRLLVR
jgi:ABC-type branched-subunit amino acid transport system substrate-binding protein